jgi:hypothetical protein
MTPTAPPENDATMGSTSLRNIKKRTEKKTPSEVLKSFTGKKTSNHFVQSIF